ncbi:MAG TPA: MFS transporter [Candidatus Limnocylindrales bacterium]|nr:MFS transporter [Candidatus Limnocylindrales bacterium]
MTAAAGEAAIWRNGAFVRLWLAGTVSYLGSFVTRTALPLAAILVLGAGPLEISALRSLELVGWLVVGLVAGAWVDRLRRRPVMVAADLGRMVLLGSIPVAAVLGVLSLAQLIVVAFLAATLSVFFDTASTAYLPTVVPEERLVPANSALSASAAAAEFTGFGLSGFLVQLFTAPIAIAVDAVSYLISAVTLATIDRAEPPRPAVHERQPVLREIRDGARALMGSPVLRALAGAHAATHVLWGVFGATYLLYAVNELGLGPAAIGVISAIGGLGGASAVLFIWFSPVRRMAERGGIREGLAGLTVEDLPITE